MNWVLDCDGVIWLADDPIPGAPEAVRRLREGGDRVVFVTNNSYPRRADHLAKLSRLGMPTADEDLVTSAGAAATLLEPGERALVLGGPGVLEALAQRGVEAVEPGSVERDMKVDAVVVGFDLKFDFARLAAATTAVRGGARLIASNDDATFPTGSGVLPGAGAFVAAVARAGGIEPVVAGKPNPPLVA
ncbi:MAG: HAD-IIA family hydrolase, partial [Acidimicrobiales bacterium]